MKNNNVIAVYSFGLCGLEIIGIEYDINDSVVWRFCSGDIEKDQNEKVHKTRIYYTTNGDAFFKAYGKRIKLSECMKV